MEMAHSTRPASPETGEKALFLTNFSTEPLWVSIVKVTDILPHYLCNLQKFLKNLALYFVKCYNIRGADAPYFILNCGYRPPLLRITELCCFRPNGEAQI